MKMKMKMKMKTTFLLALSTVALSASPCVAEVQVYNADLSREMDGPSMRSTSPSSDGDVRLDEDTAGARSAGADILWDREYSNHDDTLNADLVENKADPTASTTTDSRTSDMAGDYGGNDFDFGKAGSTASPKAATGDLDEVLNLAKSSGSGGHTAPASVAHVK